MLAVEDAVTRNTPWDTLAEWLSVQEVARYLGLTTWTIYQLCHQGAIPYRRVGKKTIQIPKSYLDPATAQKQVTV